MKHFTTTPMKNVNGNPEDGIGTITLVMTIFFLTVISFSSFSQNSVSTHAGSSQGYMDATGTSAKFVAPTGICISPDGQYLYVADYSGHRIRKINVSTKVVTTVAGNGTSGYTDGTGTAAKFSYPSGICISSDGLILYVSDYGNSYIRKIIIASGAVSTIAGNGTFSYADHTNGLSASFNSPTDIVNGGDTVLYISDTENQLIRKYNTTTTAVSTVAGMVSVPGFQNGIGTNAAFRYPKGLAVSEDGATLFVADNGNNMIRKINLSTLNVTTVAGDGVAGYSDNTNGSLAQLNAPNGVAIVKGMPDVLFVADNGNHRIRKIVLSTTAVSTTAGATSLPTSHYADNSNGMNAKFFYPTNLVVSPDAQDLFVADQGNFRVRRVKTDLASGVTETLLWGHFEVYPNPGSGFFIVNGSILNGDKVKLEVIDIAGNLVTQNEIEINNSKLNFQQDISQLGNGLYFIKISQGSNQSTKKLLIIK